jgi:hypothetical protein
MTANDIHAAIQKDILRGNYAYLREFRAGTGYSSASNRYLDAWAIQLYPSQPMLAVGIEIKLSRVDYRRELRTPMKRDSALRICNAFYFAAPVGIIGEQDLPEEAGLIEVSQNGEAHRVVEAPHREIGAWTLPFIASLARRADRKDDVVHGN